MNKKEIIRSDFLKNRKVLSDTPCIIDETARGVIKLYCLRESGVGLELGAVLNTDKNLLILYRSPGVDTHNFNHWVNSFLIEAINPLSALSDKEFLTRILKDKEVYNIKAVIKF